MHLHFNLHLHSFVRLRPTGGDAGNRLRSLWKFQKQRGTVFALAERNDGQVATSVIGIDLGKHAIKSVLLQRKGDQRYVLTNYAPRPVPEGAAAGRS